MPRTWQLEQKWLNDNQTNIVGFGLFMELADSKINIYKMLALSKINKRQQ